MNTVRNLNYGNDEDFPGAIPAFNDGQKYSRPVSHLRLVVDNSGSEPAQSPIFQLPPWFDRIGQLFGYLVLGLFLVNIVNQVVLL